MSLYFPKNRHILLLVLIIFCVTVFIINNNYYYHHEKKPYVPLNDTEMETIMKDRQEFFEAMCKGQKLNERGEDILHKPDSRAYLIDEKHHLIWCPVFKAASSSWLYNFNLLAGYSREFLTSTNQNILDFIKEKYPKATEEKLKKDLESSKSFIIVRHPFERVLDIYYDICRYTDYDYYKKIIKEIIVKYKHIPAEDITKDMIPTFSEFVNYLADNFNERIKTNGTVWISEHWTPIAEYCTPCSFRIDFILKYETLRDDQSYLIKQTNLTSILQSQWGTFDSESSASEHVPEEFSTLNKTQLMNLYAIYQYDFTLFGYSLADYLQYAQDG